MGLAFAARLAKVTEGHVWTVTRGSAIHVSSNGTETMDGLYYPGTLIVMPYQRQRRKFLIPICMMEARANQPDGIPQMVDMSNQTHCGKLLGMTMVATGVRNTLGMTEEG